MNSSASHNLTNSKMPYIDQRTAGYNERFTFTGKEKDSLRLNLQSGELCRARLTSPPDLFTSYYYFGARYYDPDLSDLFISVDPMADKYPNLSPYAYCAWNPVKLVDPDGEDPVLLGLLEYYGKAKYGNSHLGETQKIGNFLVVPFYDNNNNLIGYNAGRYRSDGSYVTEYQMEPGDLKSFSQKHKLYESAANLVYCAGEPDWSTVAFGSGISSGNIGGALTELGKMWGNALSDPSFYFSIAASIAVTGKIQSPSCNNKVALAETKIREWIGKDAKLITNSCDDIIILSKDGNKKIRFDINNTSPHHNPHIHIETKVNGKWKTNRIWPNDVESN
ncbi:MAG: hypothetical protein J6T88_03230 [Bacteroidales bacterium]|nr:hypothetical protein [Bacteroidales bacterium]